MSCSFTDVSDELRQGDVCEARPFPMWNLNDTHFLMGSTEGGPAQQILVGAVARGTPVGLVVCAHDCEIDKPKNRMGLLVAPVVPLPTTKDEEIQRIIGSGREPEGAAWEYIHLFPLHVPVEDGEDEWLVAVFDAMASVGPAEKMKAVLKKSKRHEMSEDVRRAFRMKLAAFVGRPSEE